MVPRAPPHPPRLYVVAKARSPAKCLLRFISLIFPHSRGREKPKASFPVHVGGGFCSLCCGSLPGGELGPKAVRGIGFCPWSFPSLLVCTCLGLPRSFLKILAGHKPFRLIFSKNRFKMCTLRNWVFMCWIIAERVLLYLSCGTANDKTRALSLYLYLNHQFY